MKNKSKSRHRLRDILQNIYAGSSSNGSDFEIHRKILLINIMCTIGIVFLTPFTFIAFSRGSYLVALFDFIALILMVFTFFYLRHTRDYLLAAYFILCFIGALFLYIIASGGIDNTGPLWTYVFPLVFMFLLGTKKGTIGFAIFLIFVLLILFLPEAPLLLTTYTKDFKLRFITTQVLVYIVAFFIEWGRAKTQERITGKANQLQEALIELKKMKEEQAQLQEKLLAARKLEAIGTMAGGMAHELNNQISIVEGNTQLLCQKFIGSDYKWTQRKLNSIKKASDHIAALTNQLLSFSRQQILQLETMNINDVINRNRNAISQALGSTNETVFDLESHIRDTRVDSGLIMQMIMDMVFNARDAMPKGGKLYINTTNVEKNQKQYVCLTFQDTGIGMDRETSQKIFEPFFTTKKVGQGMGLGLSSAYGIIQQHNGWIDVSSQPGKGTTLKVYFPVFQENDPESQ